MATQLAKNSPYSASFTGAAILFTDMNVAVKMLLEDNSPETIKMLRTDASYIQIKSAKSRERVTAEFVKRFRAVPRPSGVVMSICLRMSSDLLSCM